MANRRLQEQRVRFKKEGPYGRAEDYNVVRECLRDRRIEKQH